jgi:NADH-ubiquinone oxidoreductase chain 2
VKKKKKIKQSVKKHISAKRKKKKKMLISLLICLLVSNAVTLRRDKSILFSRVVIKSLLFCSFLAFNNLFTKPLEKGIGIYGGLFNITTFTQTFNIFIFLISATILVLTAFYPRKVFIKEHSSLYKLLTSKFTYNKNTISNKTSEQFRIIEYALIIVFILCGAVFLISTGDLISVFLSIELQSYGLYILSTLYRDSESATASGLTYFLLGGLSSCFILLGSALLYVNSGTTNLDNIYVISSISEIENLPALTYWYQPHYLHLSLIILFVGFLFKVSAAPFHFWSPDVYDGIPTIVTTYVAIISKISIFAFFLELVFYTEYSYLNFTWKSILLLSSLFSLIIGSVLGLTQFRIKRLFAYSTISHVGFILLALSINKAESIQAYIFYILQYSLSNLNAFIILVTIGFSLYLYVYKEKEYKNLVDVNNSPIQLINQIKGYFYINPYLAISLAITLFSFVGVPPLMGFFAKQMVLSAALDNGYIFMTLVAILTSVIGAGYYLNLIKQIFFFKDNYKINPSISNLNLVGYISPAHFVTKRENNSLNNETSAVGVRFNPNNITINSALSSTISILTLLLILFIYIPGEWFNIVSILTLILFKA